MITEMNDITSAHTAKFVHDIVFKSLEERLNARSFNTLNFNFR